MVMGPSSDGGVEKAVHPLIVPPEAGSKTAQVELRAFEQNDRQARNLKQISEHAIDMKAL
jgi:hypothetical protein